MNAYEQCSVLDTLSPVARKERRLGDGLILFTERRTNGVQNVFGRQLKTGRHLHCATLTTNSSSVTVVVAADLGERASHLSHSCPFQQSFRCTSTTTALKVKLGQR